MNQPTSQPVDQPTCRPASRPASQHANQLLNIFIRLKETEVNVIFRGYDDTKWKLLIKRDTTDDSYVDSYGCVSSYHTKNTNMESGGVFYNPSSLKWSCSLQCVCFLFSTRGYSVYIRHLTLAI